MSTNLKNIFFVLVACASMNLSAQNVNDYAYAWSVNNKTVNYDYVAVKNNKGSLVLLETAPNCGVEVGINAGVDMFNKDLTPTLGAEIGYHGRRLSFAGDISIGKGEYNKDSDKAGKSYFTTNFTGELGLRLFDLPSKRLHQKEVWLVGGFGYKLRQNYNVYVPDETDGEVAFNVKGSTMTYSLGLKFDFKNYMKKSNWYIKAVAYTGHEYYIDGSEPRFGASLSVGINFVVSGKKSKNHKAIREIFGSESDYRYALRSNK